MLPVVTAGEGVAQRAAEAVEYRGLQQKRLHLLVLPLKHFLGQEVKDVAVAPGERPYEARDVLALPHRERGQLEGCDPSLRDPFEGRDVIG